MNSDWNEEQQNSFKIDSQEIFSHHGCASYGGSFKHCSEQSATVIGMFNADESLSDLSLVFSKHVVDLCFTDNNIPTGSCVDVVCRICRAVVNVLSEYYKRIDLVDPIDRFIMNAKEERTGIGIQVDKFVTNVQDWTPNKQYHAFLVPVACNLADGRRIGCFPQTLQRTAERK
jgi:hypothetical protein